MRMQECVVNVVGAGSKVYMLGEDEELGASALCKRRGSGGFGR